MSTHISTFTNGSLPAGDDLVAAWSGDIITAARWWLPSHADRQDAVQEGYLALLKARAKFDSAQGDFDPYARSAISRAIRRVALKRRPTSPLPPPDSPALAIVDPAEVQTVVRDWVLSLPSKLRCIVEMQLDRGLTQREIAAELHVSEARISQLFHELHERGRTDLADCESVLLAA